VTVLLPQPRCHDPYRQETTGRDHRSRLRCHRRNCSGSNATRTPILGRERPLADARAQDRATLNRTEEGQAGRKVNSMRFRC